MDMFEYIAIANPSACQQLCEQYGYQAQASTTDELADCLSQLVSSEGEPALRDLASLHPDKTLILEEFGNGGGARSRPAGCSCGNCQGRARKGQDNMLIQWSHGQQATQVHQAGLFIVGGLIVLALAVISTKS